MNRIPGPANEQPVVGFGVEWSGISIAPAVSAGRARLPRGRKLSLERGIASRNFLSFGRRASSRGMARYPSGTDLVTIAPEYVELVEVREAFP